MRAPFVWEEAGIEHWTGGDLMETLLLLGDQDEADSFLEAYAAVCEDDDHALHNIHYLAQIIATDQDSDTAKADAEMICDFFGLEFPMGHMTLSPRQWFSDSSLGIKLKAAA